MKTKQPIRQGDVALIPVTAIPAGATEIKTESKRIVLAYGEVTGHAHAIYEDIDQVKVWAVGKVKYLEVMATAMVIAGDRQFEKTPGEYEYKETGKFDDDGEEIIETVVLKEPVYFSAGTKLPGVMLRHEEHTHAKIEPGIYKLPVQVEYTPQELRITRD
jgi:hypothetical protein